MQTVVRRAATTASGLVILLSLTGGARGQALETTATPVAEPPESASSSPAGLKIDLGLGAALSPAYEGSKTLRGSPIPYFSVTGLLDDRVSISAAHGVALNVIAIGGLKAGVNVNYSPGRSHSDSGRVNGLPEIAGAATVGGFITYDFRPFSVGMEVKDRLGPSPGATMSFGGDYSFSPIRRLQVSVGPKIVFADRNYEQTFFGVSESSAIRATQLGNPMRAYDATPGIKNVELSLTARYAISEHWSAMAHAGLSELVGSAANSPLTQQKFQPTIAGGIVYRF